ncbi:MAG: zinc-ribbon domain-containing protein [Alphaproteobacteria bacterium]|nr:zinc-ribbon domain-containing protein [Alphaproteobacteria bacterium]
MTSVILTCPSCQSRYEVVIDELLPSGRKVQCSHCAHVWREQAPAVRDPVQATAVVYDDPADHEARHGAEYEAAYGYDDTTDDPEPEPLPDYGAASADHLTLGRERVAGDGHDLHIGQEDAIGPTPRRKGATTLFIVAVAVIILGNIAWFGREDFVGAYPVLKSVYDIVGIDAAPGAGLVIRIDPPRLVYEGDATFLAVSVMIRNTNKRSRTIPDLVGRLSDANAETVHQWRFATDRTRITPGEMVEFTIRVADPPAEAVCLNFYFAEPAQNTNCAAP